MEKNNQNNLQSSDQKKKAFNKMALMMQTLVELENQETPNQPTIEKELTPKTKK